MFGGSYVTMFEIFLYKEEQNYVISILGQNNKGKKIVVHCSTLYVCSTLYN